MTHAMPHPRTSRRGGSGRRLTALLIGVSIAVLTGCGSKQKDPEPQVRYGVFDPDGPVIEEPRAEEPSLEQEVTLGDRLRDQGLESEAIFHYLRGVYIDGASPLPRQRVGFLQLSRDAPRAERIFRELIEKHPDLASAHMGKGLALVAQGRLTEARRSLERAVELDPTSGDARLALGMVEDEAGHHAEAQRQYRAALEIEPDRYEIRNNLGMSLLMTRDYPAAANAFREAAHLDPRDPAVYNNLGITLGHMRLYPEALQNFRRYSGEADALNNLGLICHANGDFSLAITYFERALLIGPTDRGVVLANLEATEIAQLLDRVLPSARETRPAGHPN